MPRNQRVQSSSKIYHIMVRGNERKNIFIDDEDRFKFIDILRVKKNENDFYLYAFCLMDNHIHLLINERESAIARIMKCINVSYASYFNKKYYRIGHLFQDRFKSEVVTENAYLINAVKYIHRNPIKAGIVPDLDKYNWSSYKEYLMENGTIKLTDIEFLLGIISDHRVKAVDEFIRLNSLESEDEFIDIEKEFKINTREEAINHITVFLENKGTSYSEIINEKGNLVGTLRHQLIKELMEISNLGSRQVGELLGISKSSVNNLHKK